MKNQLNPDMLPLCEDIANQLIEAFEVATVAMQDFECAAKKTMNACCDLALVIATNRVITYLEKFLKATWITRWYWKRKYKKAQSQLDKLIWGFSETPDLTFDETNGIV